MRVPRLDGGWEEGDLTEPPAQAVFPSLSSCWDPTRCSLLITRGPVPARVPVRRAWMPPGHAGRRCWVTVVAGRVSKAFSLLIAVWHSGRFMCKNMFCAFFPI